MSLRLFLLFLAWSCLSHALSLDERLLLFQKVCEGTAPINSPSLPELVKDFENESVAPNKFISSLARFFTRLENRSGPDRLSAIKAAEGLREKFSPSTKVALAEELSRQAAPEFTRAAESNDRCKLICDLANKRAAWLKHAYLTITDGPRNPVSWDFALRSLSVLFLTKAKPYCGTFDFEVPEVPKAETKATTSDDIEELRKLLEDTSLPDTSRKALKDFLDKVATIDGTKEILDVSTIYGLQYFSLILRAAESKDTSTTTDLAKSDAKHQSHLDQRAGLTKDIQGDGLNHQGQNSLYNTFAIATSVLSLPDPEGKNFAFLKQAVGKLPQPLQVPYFLEGDPDGPSERAAAARAVPLYLALYLRAPTQEDKLHFESLLIKALENYSIHLSSLITSVARNGTHVGADGIAPYYFYPSVPYALSAIRILESRSKDENAKQRFSKMTKQISGGLLTLAEKDRLFRPMGEDMSKIPAKDRILVDPSSDGVITNTGALPPALPIEAPLEHFINGYTSSPAYVNPLAGLALIATIEDCKGRAVVPSTGIIDLSLETKVGDLKTKAPRGERAHQ